MIVDDKELINTLKRASAHVYANHITSTELKRWGKTIVCIAGPSGVGKHTLCHALIKQHPQLFFLVGPTTTRKCTIKDIKENRYKFVSKNEFKRLEQARSFIYIHKTIHGFYGTDISSIRSAIKNDKIVLLVFRSFGAVALKCVIPCMLVISLKADKDVLLKRLLQRGRDKRGDIIKRLKQADIEIGINEKMVSYWKNKERGWFIIDNTLESSPIADVVVKESWSFIKNHLGR